MFPGWVLFGRFVACYNPHGLVPTGDSNAVLQCMLYCIVIVGVLGCAPIDTK